MSFRESMADDIRHVFLNVNEFAEIRNVTYGGTVYSNIPVVLTGMQEKDRRTLVSDHGQGLYMVSCTLFCAKSDIGGKLPEKGARIRVSEGNFFREYYVASSAEEMGMLRLELEGMDE